jgi:CIC family chloride channel protein
VILGAIARTLQHWMFALPTGQRLSATDSLTWAQLAMVPVGGAVLSIFSWGVRSKRRRMVDAVEANALHGGRMSVSDSLVVSGQTLISNGFGASVGLEAAYAQMGSVIASVASAVQERARRSPRRSGHRSRGPSTRSKS